jgi:hypothetical protein
MLRRVSATVVAAGVVAIANGCEGSSQNKHIGQTDYQGKPQGEGTYTRTP